MSKTDPFPWDRVFPSNEDLKLFGDELIEFCSDVEDDMAEMTEELEKLRAQMRSMNV